MLRLPPHSPLADQRTTLPWFLLGTLMMVDAIWLVLSPMTLAWPDVLLTGLACLLLLAPLAVRRYRQDERLRLLLPSMTLLLAFFSASTVLSYLVITTGAPLLDAQFAAADHWLGFDWQAYYQGVLAHPLLVQLLHWAYVSATPQLLLIVIYLATRRRRAELAEFLQLLAWTALITILISGLWPAAGAWHYYRINLAQYAETQSHFALLRSAALAQFSLADAQGLVSLPSFHTALGVLFCLALRHSRLSWPCLLLNLLMIASTPVMGGHYLVDLLAGALLPLGLLAVRQLCQPSPRRQHAATKLADPTTGDVT